MLADVGSHNLTMLRVRMGEDILDQVVPILITGDVDEGDAGTTNAALADTVKVASEKLGTPNLEALLNYLGSKLVHAILGGVADDVVDSPAAVSRGAMLADVLDAPIAKLAVGDDVDVREDLLDTGALPNKRG